jgi:hypothetical protein
MGVVCVWYSPFFLLLMQGYASLLHIQGGKTSVEYALFEHIEQVGLLRLPENQYNIQRTQVINR